MVSVPIDAASVDGLNASRNPRAGQLLALDSEARFPTSVIPPLLITDVACTSPCVQAFELDDGAVTPSKLAAGAVTGAKIAAGAVGTSQIADGSIAAADLGFDPATQAELDALSAGGTINAPGNPVAWTKLKGVPAGFADGLDADSGGDITDVVAGAGLSGGAASGSATLSVNLTPSGGDAGTATTVSRGGHVHDARYFTQGQLQSGGSINVATNPVDWTKLKGVPEGFADGVDGADGGIAADLNCSGCVRGSEIADGTIQSLDIQNGDIQEIDLGFDIATQAELDDSLASGLNPERVALLRWYEANSAGITFAVGTGPGGIAFDGWSVWVPAYSSNNVSRLRASDGATLGTFAVGAGPVDTAFDGSSVWVANYAGDTVSKLRASDGATLGTFAVDGPSAVAFDGSSVWVANFDLDQVTKLRASDGFTLGSIAVGDRPIAVAVDGSSVWVANYGSHNVSKRLTSDGADLGTFAVGGFPYSIAFDGSSIWVANSGSNTVSKLRASDGALLGMFGVGTDPEGVAFDGSSVWVTNRLSNTVSKLRASDGTPLGTFEVGANPGGIAFDGSSVWVANGGSNTVSKL